MCAPPRQTPQELFARAATSCAKAHLYQLGGLGGVVLVSGA